MSASSPPDPALRTFAGRLDAVIFDLDDTLLDWKKAERQAMDKIVADHFRPAGLDAKHVLEVYAAIQAENTQAFRATGRWWYIADRLAILTERLGSADRVGADALTTTFKAFVHGNLDFLPGAMDAIQAARRDGRKLGMLTNGPSHVQRPKIDQARLVPHFDFVGVTGELGHWKPSPKAFTAVLDKLGVQAARTVMVGDSLDFDILPARGLGMHTAWIDRDGGRHEAATVAVRTPGELVPHL